MSNIKVSFRRALEPSRAEYNVSEVMTVTRVKLSPGSLGFLVSMIGNRKKVTRITTIRYSAGDRMIVSDGNIIGRAPNIDSVFYID